MKPERNAEMNIKLVNEEINTALHIKNLIQPLFMSDLLLEIYLSHSAMNFW